ncbi:MAG: 50S ribosomal protein L29 [Candidatus Levybacteria bacterium]|nr:50S ribosomal protein L29 [Candidatus Levybacteria bacterium]
MKRNELTDLKGKTIDELKRLLLDAREELGKLKIDMSLGKSKNQNQTRNRRKDIARILTILSMKEETQKNAE